MFIAVSRSKGGCRVTRQHFHNSAVRILGDRAARIEQQRLREGRETPLFPLSLSLSFAAPPPSRASIRHLPFSDFLPSSSLAHSSDSLYRGVHLARSSFFFFPPRFCPTEREEQRGREAGTGMASVSPLIYCSQHGGSMRANQPTPLVPRVFPDDQPSRSFSPRGLSRFLARGSLRPGRRISPGQSIRPTHVASNISPTIKLAWRGI